MNDERMTLAEFLLARIAEDEAVALRARDNAGVFSVPDHVVRWTPTRVLAECEAKAKIVNMWKLCAPVDDDALLDVLHILAAVYADHPDHRTEWRP